MNDHFHILSFSIKNLDVNEVGLLHLSDESQKILLPEVKTHFLLDELMYLTTCNRVEVFLVGKFSSDESARRELIKMINPFLSQQQEQKLSDCCTVLHHDTAVEHTFELAASLDSMVIGEREIITQVRKAYEECNFLGLTGEFLRVLIRQTIQTAKEVFTQTDISKNPISVVSLAYRRLRELNVSEQSRFLIIGAGETNRNMTHYLKKHKYANFVVFNRTLNKAEKLAKDLGGKAYVLEDLKKYNKGFDVILTCTSSSEPIITLPIYQSLLNGEKSKKTIIDLAVPTDTSPEVIQQNNLFFIGIESLQLVAKENLKKREKELDKCFEIIKIKLQDFYKIIEERKVELAFNTIPKQVRQIRDIALTEVFAKEISSLDPSAKEVLQKVINYMEKKYNAVAMKTAKELLIEEKGINTPH